LLVLPVVDLLTGVELPGCVDVVGVGGGVGGVQLGLNVGGVPLPFHCTLPLPSKFGAQDHEVNFIPSTVTSEFGECIVFLYTVNFQL